jgi:hypothetical protein
VAQRSEMNERLAAAFAEIFEDEVFSRAIEHAQRFTGIERPLDKRPPEAFPRDLLRGLFHGRTER